MPVPDFDEGELGIAGHLGSFFDFEPFDVLFPPRNHPVTDEIPNAGRLRQLHRLVDDGELATVSVEDVAEDLVAYAEAFAGLAWPVYEQVSMVVIEDLELAGVERRDRDWIWRVVVDKPLVVDSWIHSCYASIVNETETQQLYQEIFRDYWGEGWSGWQGHFVTRKNSKKGSVRTLEKAPYWKGGKTIRGGYRLVKMGNHPKADAGGYVPEHVLMAELSLGAFLPSGLIVHHKNDVKTDNRLDNLQICTRPKHSDIHRKKRALEACGHFDWLKCNICKQYGPESEMQLMFRKGKTKILKAGRHAHCLKKYNNGLKLKQIAKQSA